MKPRLEDSRPIRLTLDARCALDFECCSSLKEKSLDRFLEKQDKGYYLGNDSRVYVLARLPSYEMLYMDAITGSLYSLDGLHQTNIDKNTQSFKPISKAIAKRNIKNQFKQAADYDIEDK